MERLGPSNMALLLALILLAGCTSNGQQSQPQGTARNYSGNRSRFGGNMTDAQRQQMTQQRMQVAITACQNMGEGDSCAMQGPWGSITGKCENQSGQLMCIMPYGNRTMNYSS